MTTESEIYLLSLKSIQRDQDKHLARVRELQDEARLFMAWLRDSRLTGEEAIASMEARIWWEDKK